MIHLNLLWQQHPLIGPLANMVPQMYECTTLRDFLDNRKSVTTTNLFFLNPFSEYNNSAIIGFENSLAYMQYTRDIGIVADLTDSGFVGLTKLSKRERNSLGTQNRLYRSQLQYYPKSDFAFIWDFDLNGPPAPERKEKKMPDFHSWLQRALVRS
jgi:hypothetical protein